MATSHTGQTDQLPTTFQVSGETEIIIVKTSIRTSAQAPNGPQVSYSYVMSSGDTNIAWPQPALPLAHSQRNWRHATFYLFQLIKGCSFNPTSEFKRNKEKLLRQFADSRTIRGKFIPRAGGPVCDAVPAWSRHTVGTNLAQLETQLPTRAVNLRAKQTIKLGANITRLL